MIETLFRRVAAEKGWTDAARIAVLLRYVAQQTAPATFTAFLERARHEDDPAERTVAEVVALLGDPGVALDAAFRDFCARSVDLLTPRQIAERWCCWRGC